MTQYWKKELRSYRRAEAIRYARKVKLEALEVYGSDCATPISHLKHLYLLGVRGRTRKGWLLYSKLRKDGWPGRYKFKCRACWRLRHFGKGRKLASVLSNLLEDLAQLNSSSGTVDEIILPPAPDAADVSVHPTPYPFHNKV